jgi:PKD repeat protein
MTMMSRTTKLVIIFSAIGAAVGIGITFVMVDNNQTLGMMSQRAVSESGDNNRMHDPSFEYIAKYKATLAVGEKGEFIATANFGKVPFTFKWRFSDGLSLTGRHITRNFDSPGKYYFNLTVTDADGKQVVGTDLSIKIVQQMPKEQGTGNATSTHHNEGKAMIDKPAYNIII